MEFTSNAVRPKKKIHRTILCCLYHSFTNHKCLSTQQIKGHRH
ncbi:hypothetical protein V6Z11_D02G120000 [Gossypium hirsutum]